MFAVMNASAFNSDAPFGQRRAIIRRHDGELEMVEAAWGLKPKNALDRPFRFIRSEDRRYPSYRCLVPASEFQVTAGGRQYEFSLSDSDWFYLAGIWRPETDGWPESYAILTVPANAEVARYQDRQGAVLRRNQKMLWLDHVVDEADLLRTMPDASFDVVEIRGEARQPMLAL